MKKVEKNFSALNFRINIHYFTLFYLTLLLLLKIKGYFCIAEPDKLPDRHISTDQSIDTEKIQNIHILKSNLKIYFFPYEIMQPWSVENVALMVIDFCSVLFFSFQIHTYTILAFLKILNSRITEKIFSYKVKALKPIDYDFI